MEAQERQSVLDALERYFDRMERWTTDEENPLASLPHDHPRRKWAATRTREILRRLDPKQKRDTMWFLYDHRLIMKDGTPIVRLAHADFSRADLTRLELWQTNLDGVDLSGADLSGAMLCGFHEHDASWQKALEKGGRWEDSLIPDRLSSLSGANLSGAVLRRTKLAACDVVGANFDRADLEDADLRGANLQLAQNLTQEQIESAFGSSGGLEYMPDTLLPDHLTAPEVWEKLLSQQAEERGDRASQILNEFRARRPDFGPQE